MKKRLLAIVTLLFTLFGYLIYDNYKYQDYLIFKSEPLDQNYIFTWEHPFEEVFIPIKSGGEIHALFFTQPKSKGVIFFCHGRGKNLTFHGKRAKFFLDLGYDVFIFDYRGFGKSSAGFKEEWLLEDGEIAYRYLLELYPEKKIVVYGQSLGTSVAAWVASHHSPKMLILEAPFYSLLSVAAYTKPYIPERVLKWIVKYPLRTDKWIQNVTAPIYIFHGNKDKVIPIEESKKLFEKIRHRKRAEMIIIPDWDHENLPRHNTCKDKLIEILD